MRAMFVNIQQLTMLFNTLSNIICISGSQPPAATLTNRVADGGRGGGGARLPRLHARLHPDLEQQPAGGGGGARAEQLLPGAPRPAQPPAPGTRGAAGGTRPGSCALPSLPLDEESVW